ncbi:MAG: MATE family efflux transporter [Eubacteriaceae bacterium]
MTKDMTIGSPTKVLILFMLPMLLGNIFQQFYSIVDTLIVGNFVGANALAAVGASTPLVFLIIAIAMGLSMGCSVLISQYFGAQDFSNMRKAVFVSFITTLAVGVLMSILGLLIAKPLLSLLNTPENIIEDSYTYIIIYYFGVIFLFMYNGLASICRAIGDSKTPLLFLIVAAVINIILDYSFVVYLKMGVSGVAWATLIAQGISAFSCLFYVYFRVSLLKLTKDDMVFQEQMFKDLLRYAIPSTVQQCIVSFSILAIQGLVNSYGSPFIAGFTAATKIDGIAMLPMLNIAMALSTYVAQNIGANKMDRIRSGFRVTLLIVLVMSILISTVVFFFGNFFINSFMDSNASSDAISVGINYLQIVSTFYILMGIMFTAGSVLRGAGDINAFMFSTIANFACRILAAYVLSAFIGGSAIWWSVPIGFGVGAIINLLRYKSGRWRTKSLVHRVE